ncbi:MAG: hypothetical protein LIO92_12125 [Clostridiales bacterium]|nr:hypothetical protein [Clostridiales bacterium]
MIQADKKEACSDSGGKAMIQVGKRIIRQAEKRGQTVLKLKTVFTISQHMVFRKNLNYYMLCPKKRGNMFSDRLKGVKQCRLVKLTTQTRIPGIKSLESNDNRNSMAHMPENDEFKYFRAWQTDRFHVCLT